MDNQTEAQKSKSYYQKIVDDHKLKQILSSCHLNFLLGSGVNGSFFPQLKKFVKTIEIMRKHQIEDGLGFETSLDKLKDDLKAQVLDQFIIEFNEFLKKLNKMDNSYQNINNFLTSIYSLVDATENTIESMSKINIFTFNYDDFIETMISENGYFVNVVNPKRLSTIKYHNIIAKNIDSGRTVPSFLVSKLHGQIENGVLKRENIILPGSEKLSSILTKEYFELLFRMKTELVKRYSVLIVIGYSWGDEHANIIVKECLNNGLTVVWLKYDSSEKLPLSVQNTSIIEINPETAPIDTTLTFYKIVNEIMKQ